MTKRAGAALVVAGLLTACAAPAPVPEGPSDAHPGAYDVSAPDRLRAAGWTVCAIDTERSIVDVRVAPTGTLARLGHHHLISTRAIGGHVAGRGLSAQADLFLAATDLVVDDPALRTAAGSPFQDPVPADDRAGTRGNLLGPDVLDAAEHPWLRVTAGLAGVGRSSTAPSAIIELAGNTVARPLAIDRFDAGRLSGRFELTHAELGLEPFTALGGALAVADPIVVRYDLVLDTTHDPACASLAAPPLGR